MCNVCMFVCLYVCLFVCMYMFVRVCMYYVCMYVCITWTFSSIRGASGTCFGQEGWGEHISSFRK